jgi:hypothetical protein
MRILLPLGLAFQLGAERLQQRHVCAIEHIRVRSQRTRAAIAGMDQLLNRKSGNQRRRNQSLARRRVCNAQALNVEALSLAEALNLTGAEHLLDLFDRQVAAQRLAAAAALEELGIDQAFDGAAAFVERDGHMQIAAAAALGADDGGILDHQHIMIRTALGGARTGFGEHLVNRHRWVAQEAGDAHFAGPIAAQPPHPQGLAADLDQTAQQKRPGLLQTAIAEPPQHHIHTELRHRPRDRESAFSKGFKGDV